jgi:hypothetical protein
MNKAQLTDDISAAINRNSAENGSDTPDYILAEYLVACLEALEKTIKLRGKWYGHHCSISGCNHAVDAKAEESVAGPVVELPPLSLVPPN